MSIPDSMYDYRFEADTKENNEQNLSINIDILLNEDDKSNNLILANEIVREVTETIKNYLYPYSISNELEE